MKLVKSMLTCNSFGVILFYTRFIFPDRSVFVPLVQKIGEDHSLVSHRLEKCVAATCVFSLLFFGVLILLIT